MDNVKYRKEFIISKTCIYRMYNKDNECLYIGITNNIDHRQREHKKDKQWYDEVSKIEYSDYINRNEAKIYEIYYISKLKPKYNIDHSGYTDNFSMGLLELEFKDYKIIDSDKRIISIEECYPFMRLLLDDYILFKSHDVNSGEWYIIDKDKIDNLFYDTHDKTSRYKIVSKSINWLRDRFVLKYTGSYDTYIPIYSYDDIGRNIRESELLDNVPIDIQVGWIYESYEKVIVSEDNIDRLEMGITILIDSMKELIG